MEICLQKLFGSEVNEPKMSTNTDDCLKPMLKIAVRLDGK